MRWLPIAVAMLVSGAAVFVVSALALFALGIVLFDDHDAFSPDGTGWAAVVGGILSAALPPLGLLAPLIWHSRRRLGTAAAWSLALALGVGGIGVGLRSLVPEVPVPRPRHRILWTGPATAMPADVSLVPGAVCYVFESEPGAGDAPPDVEAARVTVRDPRGSVVTVRRTEGGIITYASPDDPSKRVALAGRFTAAAGGSYTITVDGRRQIYVTDAPPLWSFGHPLADVAAALPRYAAVLAVTGIVLLALALRQRSAAARDQAGLASP
jgi:hypothetical protein